MRGYRAAAAVSTLMALAFATLSRAQDTATPQQQDQQQVRELIADAADRAVSPRGLEAVLELVARSDRERIGQGLNPGEYQKFKEQTDEVLKIWREKYRHNFHATANMQAFADLPVEFSKDDRDRDIATVQFPSYAGRTRFAMRLIRDENALWRIKVPETVSGSNFATWMTKSLSLMEKAGDKWPENTTDGYKSFTSQLLHGMNWERQVAKKEGCTCTCHDTDGTTATVRD